MYPIDSVGRGRGVVRRRLPSLVVFGLLLSFVLAALASSHAVFPFFPLVALVLLLFATRRHLRAAAWRRDHLVLQIPVDASPALPNGISKEKELLQALEHHREITAVRAALETSLSVVEAEEMLSGLANEGHVRVSAREGRLAYALWE